MFVKKVGNLNLTNVIWFLGISIIDGYLIPNPVYSYI